MIAPPCVMVVFGASGDLSARKLPPALARLAARGELADAFTLVGVARTPLSDEEFRSFARKAVADHFRPGDDESVWGELTEHFRYVTGSYDRDETFARLDGVLEELDRCRGTRGGRLHDLAVPPLVFPTRELGPNSLVVRVQPDDGITLLFGAKVPGRGFDVRSVSMEFLYGRAFANGTGGCLRTASHRRHGRRPDAVHPHDEVIESWRILGPVQQAWARGDVPLAFYPAGSWQPKEAERLFSEGRRWRER